MFNFSFEAFVSLCITEHAHKLTADLNNEKGRLFFVVGRGVETHCNSQVSGSVVTLTFAFNRMFGSSSCSGAFVWSG